MNDKGTGGERWRREEFPVPSLIGLSRSDGN